jgi:hypothetical protein
MAEPRRETASLVAAALLGAAVAPTDEQLPALVRVLRGITKTAATADLLPIVGTQASAGPAAEQAIYAYNSTNPRNRLVAVPFEPAAPLLNYPYAIRAGLSHEVTQAANLFRAAVLAAPEVFARHAFRTSGGKAGAGFPGPPPPPASDAAFDNAELTQRTLGLWTAANSASRTLALLDVTSSMGNALGNRSRSDIMIAAAQGGLELFTPDSQVGLWAFGAGHQEVLPIAALSASRRTEIGQRMSGAQPSASNRAELYDTLLAAYQLMREGYDPARPNLIVVLTDGADSDPSSLRQQQFKQGVQKLADPTRPIRVILIGVGANAADAASLQEIAGVMGGGYFPLTAPEQIQSIFLRALLRLT